MAVRVRAAPYPIRKPLLFSAEHTQSSPGRLNPKGSLTLFLWGIRVRLETELCPPDT